MRLNQYLARYTGVSRRQADDLIIQKKVKVNEELAILGQKIDPDFDEVKYNNKVLEPQKSQDQILLFYKPIFCVCTRSDPQGKKTIYDFLPVNFHNLKSAGRLDYMSEGLLILSNNGNFLNSITHPSSNKTKKYLVATKKPLSEKLISAAAKGTIEIEDYTLAPVIINSLKDSDIIKYKYLNLDPSYQWYIFVLSEGRNNQIRKMCELNGQRVLRLIRITHAEFEMSNSLKNEKYILLKKD